MNYEILLTAISERKEVEIHRVGKRLLELMSFVAVPRFSILQIKSIKNLQKSV